MVEKILLLGFGIFVLTIFLASFTPIFLEIKSSQNENIETMERYAIFSSEFDNSIRLFENKSLARYVKVVRPPNGLNITI
ncbi:MAG: hypothetical protein EU549_05120, partial [Promethearchaeota archaeon]